MLTLLGYLLTSLIFLIFAVFIYGRTQNSLRKNQKASFRLIPNCLLSRHPILLIAGEESPFYSGRYFNYIPEALREHGYEVLEFQPKSGKSRTQDIKNFIEILRDENLSCHWLCLAEDFEVIEKLKKLYPKSFSSLTLLQTKEPNMMNLNSFMHYLMTGKKLNFFLTAQPVYKKELAVLKFYLNLIRDLAEQDYKQHEEPHELRTESYRT